LPFVSSDSPSMSKDVCPRKFVIRARLRVFAPLFPLDKQAPAQDKHRSGVRS
ncbi:hypothetical protein NPIL_635711, partial [Nephila pilipes]